MKADMKSGSKIGVCLFVRLGPYGHGLHEFRGGDTAPVVNTAATSKWEGSLVRRPGSLVEDQKVIWLKAARNTGWFPANG